MRVYLVKDDLGVNAWRSLMRWVRQVCDSMQLVVERDGVVPSARAKEFVEKLRPYVVQDAIVSEWPGTRLLRDRARLVRFAPLSHCIDSFEAAGSGLFDWVLPSMPEDPSFFSGERCLFSVTAHERFAMFEIAEGDPPLPDDVLSMLQSSDEENSTDGESDDS